MINLQNAIVNNKLEEVRLYIQNTKREKDWRWCFDSNHVINDACRDAVLLGHDKIVQLFLDEGLGPDTYAHESGHSGCVCPLKFFAAKVGNLSLVKLLVSKGAKIQDSRRFHDENDNQQAMRAAIENGSSEIVQYLLENGGSANGIFDGLRRQTFLGRAAFEGQKSLVDLLVKHGARIKNALYLNEEQFRKLYKNYNYALSNYNENNRSWKLKYASETEMKNGDNEKQELLKKRDILFRNYSASVQMLLDYAMGIHFEEEKTGSFGGSYDGLTFLKDLDITSFNFVGVSLNAQPITREILVKMSLKGADQALVTLQDINNLKDHVRTNALLEKLEAVFHSQGKIILQHGTINLVPLADAAKKGDADVVLVRLSAGVNPNQKTSDELDSILAIVAAAKNGFSEVVQLLAEHPELDKKSLITAAHAAEEGGHLELAEYISSLSDVNEKDKEGNALIHKAVQGKDIEKIKRLLSRGADINLENEEGKTPLLIACSNAGNIEWGRQASPKDIELIEFLLAHGADPNKYKREYSPLQAAAKGGSFKVVALLLPVTEKRDIKNTVGYGDNEKEIIKPWYVPLLYDSYGSKEWLEIISLLKTHGADLNVKDLYESETLLYRFVRDFPSFTDIKYTIRELQRSIQGCESRLGPNPLQKDYENLIQNARNKFSEKLKKLDFLLENGADPRITCGDDNSTPLHILIEKIDLGFIEGATEEVIERFLKYGVEVNTPDAWGSTPLHVAASTGDLAAIAYLLSKGADVKARTKLGLTPLHLAAAGKPRATQLLIKAGADVNSVDEKGLTPLAYSRQACINNNELYVHPNPEREQPYYEAQRELLQAGGM